jgi:hypothetical protein
MGIYGNKAKRLMDSKKSFSNPPIIKKHHFIASSPRNSSSNLGGSMNATKFV